MSEHRVGPIRFHLPEGFCVQESKAVWSKEPDGGLDDPMLALLGGRLSGESGPAGARANVIVRRRRIDPARGVGYVARELVAKTLHNMGGDVRELKEETLTFGDGAEGALLSFEFPAGRLLLRQLHAFRLDDERLSHATWTVEAGTNGSAKEAGYRDILASLRPTDAAGA